MNTLANNYVFKALDAYPYDLEEVVEALHYALSYDDKNIMALCLMGRLYTDILCDYELAKSYFVKALAENMNALEVYPFYIKVLLRNEDFTEAEKLIDFALGIKGIDKAAMLVSKAHLYECLKEYKKALVMLKEAKIVTYNSDFMSTINEEKVRIKSKMPKKKKDKKKKNKKTKTKKKE